MLAHVTAENITDPFWDTVYITSTPPKEVPTTAISNIHQKFGED